MIRAQRAPEGAYASGCRHVVRLDCRADVGSATLPAPPIFDSMLPPAGTRIPMPDGPKPYKFIGFGDIHGPEPYKFIGFGDIHGPKPYTFTRFGNIHGPKPNKIHGVWLVGWRGPFPRKASGLLSSPSLRMGNEDFNLYLVFDRFPAELGPETRSNGSGLTNGADRTQNEPRRPIINQFINHSLVQTHNAKIEMCH